MPSSTDDSTIDDMDASWAAAGEEARERTDSVSRAEFEARAVQHVLKGCGLAHAAPFLANQARDLTGDPTISFALVRYFVPDLPVRLGVAKLFYLREKLTLEGLFKRPAKSLPYMAFQQWAEEDHTDDERPRGIIFRLPGCPGNGSRAILHTYPVPFEGERTRVTFGVRERGVGLVLYTLEPLDQLLAALIRTYRPADDYQ